MLSMLRSVASVGRRCFSSMPFPDTETARTAIKLHEKVAALKLKPFNRAPVKKAPGAVITADGLIATFPRDSSVSPERWHVMHSKYATLRQNIPGLHLQIMNRVEVLLNNSMPGKKFSQGVIKYLNYIVYIKSMAALTEYHGGGCCKSFSKLQVLSVLKADKTCHIIGLNHKERIPKLPNRHTGHEFILFGLEPDVKLHDIPPLGSDTYILDHWIDPYSPIWVDHILQRYPRFSLINKHWDVYTQSVTPYLPCELHEDLSKAEIKVLDKIVKVVIHASIDM